MHCGFCTATCPTYVLLGDELDSPRGRIYLMKQMLESGKPADAEVVKHIDRCLSCLSCMTTCPSGVHYMHLVDHGRAYIEDTYGGPGRPAAALRARGACCPIRAVPPGLRRRGRLARPFARLDAAAELRAMLALAPRSHAGAVRRRPAAGVPGRGPAPRAASRC